MEYRWSPNLGLLPIKCNTEVINSEGRGASSNTLDLGCVVHTYLARRASSRTQPLWGLTRGLILGRPAPGNRPAWRLTAKLKREHRAVRGEKSVRGHGHEPGHGRGHAGRNQEAEPQ